MRFVREGDPYRKKARGSGAIAVGDERVICQSYKISLRCYKGFVSRIMYNVSLL
jgi:hypothetical protein